MTTLYFIITKGENHLSILNDGGGASELLFSHGEREKRDV